MGGLKNLKKSEKMGQKCKKSSKNAKNGHFSILVVLRGPKKCSQAPSNANYFGQNFRKIVFDKEAFCLFGALFWPFLAFLGPRPPFWAPDPPPPLDPPKPQKWPKMPVFRTLRGHILGKGGLGGVRFSRGKFFWKKGPYIRENPKKPDFGHFWTPSNRGPFSRIWGPIWGFRDPSGQGGGGQKSKNLGI